MKFEFNKEDWVKVGKILTAKENSIQAAEFYIDYLRNHPRDIESAKNPEDWFKQFNKIERVYPEIVSSTKMDVVTELDVNEFLNDKYYREIGQIKAEEGDWKFSTYSYAPYEGFVSDELVIDQEYYAEHTPISYFTKEFPFFAVTEKDEIWMSIIPHEINTMKEPIKNAFGDVLVLGLGLGYYLFNIVSKKEVKSVTVIENDKRIINLFNKYLLPKFPHQEKITILYDDAIKFVKKDKRQFDYVFADIWHNVSDGEMLYLKLKSLEKLHPNTKFDYWIETSILAMLRRQTLTILEEWMSKFTEEDYKYAKNDNDRIINAIYFYTKNTVIKNFDDLYQILSDESLKLMATKLF